MWETKWQSGKQHLIRFATFLWIVSTFYVDIWTKCLTVFKNKVIILVHVVRVTLGGVFWVKIQQNSSMILLWSSAWVATVTSTGSISRLEAAYIYVGQNHKNNSFQWIKKYIYLAANT